MTAGYAEEVGRSDCSRAGLHTVLDTTPHMAWRHTLARGHAYVTRVNGRSFRSANTINRRRVFLNRSKQRARRRILVHSFPPHSVTVLRVPIRHR